MVAGACMGAVSSQPEVTTSSQASEVESESESEAEAETDPPECQVKCDEGLIVRGLPTTYDWFSADASCGAGKYCHEDAACGVCTKDRLEETCDGTCKASNSPPADPPPPPPPAPPQPPPPPPPGNAETGECKVWGVGKDCAEAQAAALEALYACCNSIGWETVGDVSYGECEEGLFYRDGYMIDSSGRLIPGPITCNWEQPATTTCLR